MPYEIVTTHFVAHEHDLDDAYATYQARIRATDAEIAATSPHPHPIEDLFFLWDLRTEAAYDNLQAPEEMRLYELNALVNFAPTNRDEAIEQFFLDDLGGPVSYPSSLGGLTNLTIGELPSTNELSLVTVVYLGTEMLLPKAQFLFDDLLHTLTPTAYQPHLAPLDAAEQAALVGPLWVRDATLNIIGKGDGIFSPGKDGWAGWLLTDKPLTEVEAHLKEHIEPGGVVLARAVREPF